MKAGSSRRARNLSRLPVNGARLGKVENCQTGVFATPNKGKYSSIIDTGLYLPSEWTADRKRCKAAAVLDDVVFKTKSELAIEMVILARKRGLGFS